MALNVRTVVTNRQAQRALLRLAEQSPLAIRRALLKIGFLVGRSAAENIEGFKQNPPGTRRLSRSFLIPVIEGLSVVLGQRSPIYAAIHEYGGTIRAKNAPYLVFETADGVWHSVKEVTITEKRYARDAIEENKAEALGIMGLELAEAWRTP
jgi:hypothetical protein